MSETTTLELGIDGLMCGACAARVEKKIAKTAGVVSTSVNLATGSMVDGESIVSQPSVCSDGEVLIYNASGNDWVCGVDSDTTLTPTVTKLASGLLALRWAARQSDGAAAKEPPRRTRGAWLSTPTAGGPVGSTTSAGSYGP